MRLARETAVTHYRMPKQSIDDKRGEDWSIAFLNSVGAGQVKGGNLAAFDLVNMETRRAHRMVFTGGGESSGLPVELSFVHSRYVRFRTSKLANFPDFDKKRASLEIKDRIARSKRSLTVYNGLVELMSVDVTNWNPTGWSGFDGDGFTEVYYSDGLPVDDPQFPVKIDLPPGPENIQRKFQIAEKDFGLVIRMPGDILFDFNRDVLHYQASAAVGDLMNYMNTLPPIYTRVSVEGHTDSVGDPAYNMGLSKRRAKAVIQYFHDQQWVWDRKYKIDPPVGYGATRPLVPNKKPNGADDPDGRQTNRRVEVILYLK
jgi:outer membrane protein OmpA-like peptidoglycan-associated protein